jgi:C4-dicarboxylate transporter DctM subunit
MDPTIAAIIGAVFMLVLLALGLQIGACLAIGGFFGLLLYFGDLHTAMAILTNTPYTTTATFNLAVMPLVILMGSLAMHVGITETAYDTVNKWVGDFPGGLAISTVVASAAFGAACASSMATAALFSKVSYPPMKKAGYQPKLLFGSIAAGGTLGMLIPPSGTCIIYGILTEQSIAQLFIAGIGPGILLTIIYATGIYILAKRDPRLAPKLKTNVSWRERILSLKGLLGIGLLAAVILGGIYSGIFTATEAGATGCFAAFLMFFISKNRSWRRLWDALLDAGRTNATIFLILIGAMIFARMLAVTGLTSNFVEFVGGSGLPPMAILGLILLMYIIMGCFLDLISMMVMTLPFIFPLTTSLGFDPIWFGLTAIVAIEMGLMTPPLGINVYTIKATVGEEVSLEEIFKACVPFVLMMFLGLILVVFVPQIITWLPSVMFQSAR